MQQNKRYIHIHEMRVQPHYTPDMLKTFSNLLHAKFKIEKVGLSLLKETMWSTEVNKIDE